jgi:hypothetical protein
MTHADPHNHLATRQSDPAHSLNHPGNPSCCSSRVRLIGRGGEGGVLICGGFVALLRRLWGRLVCGNRKSRGLQAITGQMKEGRRGRSKGETLVVLIVAFSSSKLSRNSPSSSLESYLAAPSPEPSLLSNTQVAPETNCFSDFVTVSKNLTLGRSGSIEEEGVRQTSHLSCHSHERFFGQRSCQGP